MRVVNIVTAIGAGATVRAVTIGAISRATASRGLKAEETHVEVADAIATGIGRVAEIRAGTRANSASRAADHRATVSIGMAVAASIVMAVATPDRMLNRWRHRPDLARR